MRKITAMKVYMPKVSLTLYPVVAMWCEIYQTEQVLLLEDPPVFTELTPKDGICSCR